MSVSKRSIVQFILLQVSIAILGLWVISGIVQQFLLKRALIEAYHSSGSEIQTQLYDFKASFPLSSTPEILETLNDLCEPLGCLVESLELSTFAENAQNVEEIRMVAVANPEDIPIVLEVFHRLPHHWSVSGLEVQAFEQPFRFQVRFQRDLLYENSIEWHPLMKIMFVSSTDEQQIATLLEWQTYKHYYEVHRATLSENNKKWGQLYQSLNTPLWTLRSNPGKLTFTPTDGVRIQVTGELRK